MVVYYAPKSRSSLNCIVFSSVIDPACGTAGFLVSSSEYIREKFEDSMTDAQWENFDGPCFTSFDTDPRMLRISAMNLMLHFKGTVDAESINDNLKTITNTKIQEKQLQRSCMRKRIIPKNIWIRPLGKR